MQLLDRIFARPFEVTRFWASEKYMATALNNGNAVGHLYKFWPEHVRKHGPNGKPWCLEVCDGDDDTYAGDFLHRILPTRNNIVVLNQGCLVASRALGEGIDRGDDVPLFPGLLPYNGGVMDIAVNDSYRVDLWKVLADDWGLELPEPDRFGTDVVKINHRPGLPCAAAMVGAVQPIIEALQGELKLVGQSTSRDGDRIFDVMKYSRPDGRAFVQRYDITDVYGRTDLDWKYFQF